MPSIIPPPASSDSANVEPALRVLLLEDDMADRIMVQRRLKEMRRDFTLDHCGVLEDAKAALLDRSADIVLADLNVPDAQGVEIVRELVTADKTTPIVVLTGLEDDRVAIEAVQCGAQDYLQKGELEARSLERSIHHAIERHRLMQDLEYERAQDVERKDNLLSHVGHELRTPLTAISEFVSLMIDGLAGELSEQQTSYLQIVDRNVDHLARMIRDLMDVARMDSGKLELDPDVIDARALLSEAVGSLREAANRKNVDLRLAVPESLPPVVADRTRILQVLVNLIDNATKFTPEGGCVAVDVQQIAEETVQVTVADTGCGMSPETLSRVFERLYQADRPIVDSARHGLGIGLHISREIVEMHGGVMHVDSSEGEGSRFSFTLAVHDLEFVVRRVLGTPGECTQVCLLTVTLSPTRRPTPKAKLGLGAARTKAAIEKCVVGVNDHLLPGQTTVGDEVQVAVMLRADESGGRIVECRVRDYLLEHASLPIGLELEVALHVLDVNAAGDDETQWSQTVSELATRVSTRLLSKETVQ